MHDKVLYDMVKGHSEIIPMTAVIESRFHRDKPFQALSGVEPITTRTWGKYANNCPVKLLTWGDKLVEDLLLDLLNTTCIFEKFWACMVNMR